MQSINHFSKNYIEPVINHSATKFASKIVVEGVMIVATKVFLEYIGVNYLNHPKKISRWVIREETVWSPIREELIFRLGLSNAIHLLQKSLNRGFIQLASTLYGPTDKKSEEDQKKSRVVYLPPEYDLIYHAIKKGMKWMRSFDDLTDQEEADKVQRFFRIHFTALIFAAAHLMNPHPNKISALKQFLSAYIGGLAYGSLTEKYQSLAPAILFHGVNNCLANAADLYSKDMIPLLSTAIVAARVASFILGMT